MTCAETTEHNAAAKAKDRGRRHETITIYLTDIKALVARKSIFLHYLSVTQGAGNSGRHSIILYTWLSAAHSAIAPAGRIPSSAKQGAKRTMKQRWTAQAVTIFLCCLQITPGLAQNAAQSA